MYAAIGLQALAAILYALPVDALGFGIIRGLQGFAFGVASTVNMALFIDSLAPNGNQHRHLAAYASALSLGFTFGGLGGGLLGYWLGYGPAFLCAAAISLLAVPCTTAPQRGAERPPSATAPVSPDRWVRVRALRVAVTHPQVLSISLVSFFLQVLHHMGQTFVPLYALGIGLNLATIGILRSTHSLANTVARPFGGEITRWLGYDRVAVWGLAAIAALLMLTPLQDGLLGLLILFVAIGVGRAAVLVANTVSVADLQDGSIPRGVAVGVYSAARDLGGIAGPLLGGYVAAALGLRTFFWVAPPLTFAIFGLLFWQTQRRRLMAESCGATTDYAGRPGSPDERPDGARAARGVTR